MVSKATLPRRMPAWRKTRYSYLAFCAILATFSPSSSGLRRDSAFSGVNCFLTPSLWRTGTYQAFPSSTARAIPRIWQVMASTEVVSRSTDTRPAFSAWLMIFFSSVAVVTTW